MESEKKYIKDYKLLRYACYLIAQNVNYRKEKKCKCMKQKNIPKRYLNK